MAFTKRLILSVATLAIVASTSSMAFGAGKRDVSKVFTASYEATVEASKAALGDLKLRNKGVNTSGGTTVVSFARPVTGFSWGEKGTITIIPQTTGTTKVTVGSKKNNPLQVTGKNTKKFASEIFAAIQARLN